MRSDPHRAFWYTEPFVGLLLRDEVLKGRPFLSRRTKTETITMTSFGGRPTVARLRVCLTRGVSRTLELVDTRLGAGTRAGSAAGSDTQCRQQHQNQGADGEDAV